jgi:hypothetical protein
VWWERNADRALARLIEAASVDVVLGGWTAAGKGVVVRRGGAWLRAG